MGCFCFSLGGLLILHVRTHGGKGRGREGDSRGAGDHGEEVAAELLVCTARPCLFVYSY